MGIPQLITLLRPYSELEPLGGCDVVVDGPGLCYHVYYKCLGRREDARNAFEVAPSYHELQRASIEWLDGLCRSGAVVKRIYFDGFLPPTKLNTRFKRLNVYAKQLSDYHNTHPIPGRALSSNRGESASSMFASQSPRPALTILPAPPFLVPAILEALGASEYYKPITEVVPGEADLYCAMYLNQHGGLVLTGDSDLLVHDLGSNGAVAFFKDVEESPNTKSMALQSQVHRPAAIAQRLGLPKAYGLLALGFEMFMDNHGTFPSLVSRASALKAVKANKKLYEDFRKEYMLPGAGLTDVQNKESAQNIFQSLDPRISEVVLQFPTLANLAGQDPTYGSPSQDAPHMFLPFLHDWPIRTSAWEMSTSVRQLAYGLINLMVPEAERRFSVHEHRKQQGKSNGREWQLPSIAEIPEACMAVVKLLDQLQKNLPIAIKVDLWLAAAICQDIEWACSLDKTPLSRLAIEQLFDLGDPNKYHKNCSWEVMQYLAQIQGSYYSFRILKQILNVVVVHDSSHLLPEAVQNLHDRLEALPVLCDVPDLHCISSLYRKIEGNQMLKVAHKIVGIEEPQPVVPVGATKSAKKKRKRQGGQAENGPLAEKKKSANPFDMLGLD